MACKCVSSIVIGVCGVAILLTRGTSGLYFQVSGCPNFQTPAKPASDWLETKPRAASYGRIHVTKFKILSSTKALQSSASSSAKAQQKLCTNLRTKLCKSSTKGFTAPLPTQCTSHAVDGACSAQGGPRGSPLEALLEALLEASLKALYGALKLY